MVSRQSGIAPTGAFLIASDFARDSFLSAHERRNNQHDQRRCKYSSVTPLLVHQPNTSITFSMASTNCIRFFFRVVERERGARRRRQIESLHHRLRAMMSGAYGDALLIQNRANVVRMDVFNRE